MSKFKVGDKVRTFVGIGVIKYIDNDDAPYLVYYQGWNKGHNGGLSQMNFSGNHCLWHVEDALSAVNELSSSRKTLPLSCIHITSAFSDHLPDPKKIAKCYEFFKANGEFNKDIVINMRNVLVDGYVAYLVAKMVGMENVPVLQTNSDTLDKPKKAKEPDFDWEAFKAGKIAAHVGIERADYFLKEAAKHGVKWCDGALADAANYTCGLCSDSYYRINLDGKYLVHGTLPVQQKGCAAVEFPFPATSKPAPEKPAKAAPKFKVGDKVKVVKNVTTVSGKDRYIGNVYEIRNLQGVREYGHIYGIGETYVVHEDELEPYSEPAPVSAEPDKQEVVKLYCVKDYRPGEWITKGKTYLVEKDGTIQFDDGYSPLWSTVNTGGSVSRNLCPLVKRPAKVGEWVLITDGCEGNAWNASHEIYNGRIYNVVGFGFAPIIKTADETDYGWSILDGVEYLVLDGYQPEPEKPKYYSGKVVCVSTSGVAPNFTVGKVYEYREGLVNCDKPKPYNEGNPAKTKEEALNRLFVTFIELKQ